MSSPFGPHDADASVPEWAKIQADFGSAEVDDGESVWEPDSSEHTGVPSESRKKPRMPRRRSGRSSTRHQPSLTSDAVTGEPAAVERPSGRTRAIRRRLAGGRWQILLLRAGLWLVLTLLVALGVWRIADPVPIEPSSIVAEVEERLNITDFPQQQGLALAQRYVQEYFTYTRGEVDPWDDFFGPGTPPRDFIPAYGSDVLDVYLVSGPSLTDDAQISSATSAVYTFTVQVSTTVETPTAPGEDPIAAQESQRWLEVSVPVQVTDTGQVALVSPLAWMPVSAPALIANAPSVEVDDVASEDAQEYLELYFQQWAESSPQNPVSSAYLIADRSSASAQFGLAGEVELERLRSLQVFLPDPDAAAGSSIAGATPRTASAEVVWVSPQTGSRFVSTYALELLPRDDYWYVLDIRGGALRD